MKSYTVEETNDNGWQALATLLGDSAEEAVAKTQGVFEIESYDANLRVWRITCRLLRPCKFFRMRATVLYGYETANLAHSGPNIL